VNVERAASRIDPQEFERMVAEQLGLPAGFRWRVVDLARGWATLELEYDASMVRPGGTVSGPTLFALADLSLYAAVLSTIGMQPLAVTSELTIHFLRRPPPVTMRASAEVLRAGSTLVHGDVRIHSAGEDEPVCHATGTYAVPRARDRAGTPPLG
jgi:uncharacterized protein (TIGR00369 family)